MFPVIAVFFASGAAGLVFEVIWLHECGLALGNSVWAMSIALSSFMAGLALGSFLVGRFGSRSKHPLRTYAMLEATVAAAGIAATLALPALSRIVTPIIAAAPDSPALINGVRLATPFFVLLLPASAMGATLPILAGGLGRDGAFGTTIGRLYGWNTLGAVTGVIAAEVVLVDALGIRGTTCVAAGVSSLAAATAWALPSRPLVANSATRSSAVDRNTGTGQGQTPSRNLRVAALLIAAFLAGCALLGLEVAWFRFLTMFVLSTTLAATLMIAAVLAAIAAGSLAAARWLRADVRAATQLPLVATAAAVVTVAAYGSFNWLTLGTQVAAWQRVLWFAVALAAPTSFLSGALFTLIGDALEAGMDRRTRAAAWLTLANTAGAACGPPVVAFVLLPGLGIERTIFAACIAYLLIAMVSAPAVVSRAARPRRALLAAAVLASIVLPAFPFGLMEREYFRRASEPYAADGSQIIATREGPSETIFLMERTWLGKPVYDRLVTNGFSMTGTSTPALRYMRAFAYWPLFFGSAPIRHALVICYGAGVTAGAVLDLPGLERLDIVEVSREIAGMSDLLYDAKRNPLRDPRVRLHIDDGRFFLATSPERFDLITGEPPPPRTPGAVNIYTREYFSLIRDRLAEGGITTYWLPVARPDPGTDVDTIIRAFCDVFEDCSLWNGTPSDLMLVGTRGLAGRPTDAGPVANPTLADRLHEIGIESPPQMAATFLGDGPFLRELTSETPPLTDDFPQRLIPTRGRPSLSDPFYRSDAAALARYQRVLDPRRARALFAQSAFIRGLWPEAPRIEASLPAFDHQRIVNGVLIEGANPQRHIEDLHHVLTETRLTTLPLWMLGGDAATQRIAEGASERSGATEYALGVGALAARDYLRAAAHLGEAERRRVGGATVRALQVYALCLGGDVETARRLARVVSASEPDERHFWSWMRETYGIDVR